MNGSLGSIELALFCLCHPADEGALSPVSPNRPPQKTVPGRKINELLASGQPTHSPLQKLLQKANAQIGWTRDLRAVLPPELARDCRVLDIRGPVLVIGCRSAATATRLRFDSSAIIQDLNGLQDFSGVNEIQLQIVNAL